MECGYLTNPADRLNEAVISRLFRIESYAALSRPLKQTADIKAGRCLFMPLLRHSRAGRRTGHGSGASLTVKQDKPQPQRRRRCISRPESRSPVGIQVGRWPRD